MVTDMTEGNPYGLLIRFVIPVYLGSIFQHMYTAVDTLVVGRHVGVDALAALGAAGVFCWLMVGFGQGLTMGFGILLSQRYGAKDGEGLRKTYAMSLRCSLNVSILLGTAAMLLAKPLLLLIDTPSDIIADAWRYVMVVFAAMPAHIFYELFAQVLRAVGDSRSPLRFLVIASVTNIILDLVFVVCFDLDVIGVAAATAFAQTLSAVLTCIFIMKRHPELRIGRTDIMEKDRSICRELYRLGIPGALMNTVCAIGCVFVHIPLNRLGSRYVAAFSLGNRMQSFLMAVFPCLGNAIATYTGQNYGARDYGRLKKGFKAMCVITLCCVILTMIAAYTLARPAAELFMSGETADGFVLDRAAGYIYTVSWAWLWLGSIFVFRTGCQGLGSAQIPVWSSIVELATRCIGAFTLPGLVGPAGVVLSDCLAWVTAGTFCPFCWIYEMRKVKRKIGAVKTA